MAANVLLAIQSSNVGAASCKSHHHFDEGVLANSFFHTRTVPPGKGNPSLRILCPLKQAHRDLLPRLRESFTGRVFSVSPSCSPHWDSTRNFRLCASNLSDPPGDPEESGEHTYRILKLRETAKHEAEQTKFDTADDAIFYERPRFLYHTDQSYVDRLTALYRRRLKEGSRILDLMSSWVSHLPADMSFEWVEGHGIHEAELLANKRLDHFWIQDLNKNQTLPHEDEAFDAVLISLGIQYLENPRKVLQDVARILSPGGLLIANFSKHSYTEKAVTGWLRRTGEERLRLVKDLFLTAGFEEVETETCAQALENEDLNSISDPFYAVLGTKSRQPEQARIEEQGSASYKSLALHTLTTAQEVSNEDTSYQLLEQWANAYEVMAKEALELGIPKHAIPELTCPLSRERIIEARDLLSGIIESRMSSNL